MRERRTYLLRLLAIALVLSCTTCTGPRQSGDGAFLDGDAGSRIDEINLLAMPVAINLDSTPGVDGFAIKVYAVDRSKPKTQPIKTGALQIRMYDGHLQQVTKPDSPQSRHVWTFSAAELKSHAFATTIGTGYDFTLNWGADRPRDDKISVIARYQPPQGLAVYSAPSSISVPIK